MTARRAVAGVLAGLLVLALVATGARATAPRTTGARTTGARAARTTRVPQGFVGVDVDGPVTAAGTTIDLADQLGAMVANGVQSIRVAFNWAAAEPYQSPADVPASEASQFTDVAGVPVDFAQTDAIVATAARRHLSVLPTILYAPPWDGVPNPGGAEFPRTPGPYAAYAAALVHRYGPHGTFWSQNPGIPKRPITEWQIWNEPDLSFYWHQPFERGYTSLLRAAHGAIKRADPRATIVLGALTNTAWVVLARLERQRGFSGLFDVAAVDAYTRVPAHVILYLRYFRRALDQAGAWTTPILATELGWPAAAGQVADGYDFDVTPAQQARNITALLPQLGAERTSLELAGFDYYTWMGTDSGPDPFFYAGLLADVNGTVRDTPALAAFRRGALALEGCRGKGPVATDCRR